MIAAAERRRADPVSLAGGAAVQNCIMAREDAAVPKMADLFDPEPETWGLRGDPYLWRALREHLSGTDMPASTRAAVSVLYAAFSELAGLDPMPLSLS